MKRFSKLIFGLVFIFLTSFAFAQDENAPPDEISEFENFDTMFSEDSTADQSSNFQVNVGGDLNTGGKIFFNDFKTFKDMRASSLLWGKLHVEAVAPITKAYFGIKINDMVLPFNFYNKPKLYPTNPQIPRFIDEAYVQANFGAVSFGGGLKKLTWGKADAFSVLDVVNAQDFSDPTISDMQDLKLARPMLYLSAYLPMEMKLELAFLPIFEGNQFALTGRWASKQASVMQKRLFEDLAKDPDMLSILALMTPTVQAELTNLSERSTGLMPEIDSAKLKYAQAGLRYTATVNGYHDVGLQYYYGFLPNPALQFNKTEFANMVKVLNSAPSDMAKIEMHAKKAFALDYSAYHQIGIDYALAFGPLNFRAEFAANITNDLKGTKPNVYNPSLAWHLGFDYTTPFGLSFNFGVSENIKLMHKKIGTELYDLEKGSNATDTKLMLLLSQPFLRNSLNLNLRTVMAVETVDFFVVPSIDWTFGTLQLNLATGFFFGKKNGVFSQYKDNNYLSVSISYGF